RPAGALDDAVVRPRRAADRVLLLRQAEEEDRQDALAVRLPAGLDQAVDRLLEDPRHRAHGDRHPLAGTDAKGEHEMVGGEPRLPHQPAQGRRPAEAAQPGLGEGHARGFTTGAGRDRRRESSPNGVCVQHPRPMWYAMASSSTTCRRSNDAVTLVTASAFFGLLRTPAGAFACGGTPRPDKRSKAGHVACALPRLPGTRPPPPKDRSGVRRGADSPRRTPPDDPTER